MAGASLPLPEEGKVGKCRRRRTKTAARAGQISGRPGKDKPTIEARDTAGGSLHRVCQAEKVAAHGYCGG